MSGEAPDLGCDAVGALVAGDERDHRSVERNVDPVSLGLSDNGSVRDVDFVFTVDGGMTAI